MPGQFGCPGEKPEEAAECTRMFKGACVYDDGGCVCTDGAWDCYADADCPATAPADAAACTLDSMQCEYEGLDCTCSVEDGWSCVSPCPEATPEDSASCRRPTNSTCRYAEGELVGGFGGKADTTCACGDDSQFTCFSDADCPAAAPENESACEFNTLSCDYEDRECDCRDGAWNCETECPAAEPADGAECLRAATAACRYAEGAIVQGGFGSQADSTCVCEEGAFSCFGAEDCPAAAPATAEACEFKSLSCDFTDSQCTCGNDGTWGCQTDCPAAPPAQAAACERPEQATCRYNDDALVSGGGFGGAAETICACREKAFDCLTEADCPAAAPEAEAACEGLNGLACNYGDERCTCGQNGWSCQTECPAAPPAAGAACNRPAFPACEYTAGALVQEDGEQTCLCDDNVFVCYTAADCPAAQPENEAACTAPGLECAYGETSCRCRTSTDAWSCMAQQPPMGAGGMAGGGMSAGGMSAGGMSAGGMSAGGASQ